MATRLIKAPQLRILSRLYSDKPGSQTNTSTESVNISNAKGLSLAVIANSSEPVGPGVAPDKSGAYKSPEYFLYNNMSFFEAEVEMAKYRLPAPSALKK